MTEPRAPYTVACDMTEFARSACAESLAIAFTLWVQTYPTVKFTEETLRRICQEALALYEDGKDKEDGKDV